jgi:GNAT superfamily N-acetyltransferase
VPGLLTATKRKRTYNPGHQHTPPVVAPSAGGVLGARHARHGDRYDPWEPTAAGDFEDARWPAHLHINVLPHVRGAGVAPALMHRWLQVLRQTDSRGCYLQTLVENGRAVRFFTRMGFAKYGPTPVVPGLRYEGKQVHQQTMVWSP